MGQKYKVHLKSQRDPLPLHKGPVWRDITRQTQNTGYVSFILAHILLIFIRYINKSFKIFIITEYRYIVVLRSYRYTSTWNLFKWFLYTAPIKFFHNYKSKVILGQWPHPLYIIPSNTWALDMVEFCHF